MKENQICSDCVAKITLPFPPSVNELFGGGARQQRFPSTKYKAWLRSCPPLTPLNLTNVKLDMKVYFPSNRQSDLDNRLKAINDYLVKKKVIVDDSWQHLKQITITAMGIDKDNPRVEILVDIF